MTKSHIMMALLFALFFFSNNDNALVQNCPLKVPVGESGLRKYKATKKVKPVYPEESLKNKVTGRVAVNIRVDENGKVQEAKVKEAPDELTGQAVLEAAKQWEFQPPPKLQGKQTCYLSTLSFKFEIKNGKGKIEDDPLD